MRQAKLTRVFVDGKALRIKGFSVAISGLPMLTKPTSSAPASRHIWRKTLCEIVWGVVDGTLLRRAMTEGCWSMDAKWSLLGPAFCLQDKSECLYIASEWVGVKEY
jgi:hypothetical protein